MQLQRDTVHHGREAMTADREDVVEQKAGWPRCIYTQEKESLNRL